MVRSKTISSRVADALIVLILALVAIMCFYPIWYTISMSFSDTAAASAGYVRYAPVGFNLSSYKIMLSDHLFYNSFLVSVKRVLLGCSIQYVLTIITAYPLSRDPKRFRGRTAYLWCLVFCMLFSGGLIPTYMTVTALGLQNSLWALVLPGAVPIFNIILMSNFFRGLPKELDEAAVMDGAGPWYMLLRIYVPLSTPSIATVTLFSIVGHWNSFFDGLIYMNTPEHYPLQTYIQQMVVALDPSAMATLTPDQLAQLLKITDKTLNAAKLVVAMIPILLLYPFLQRFFVKGIVVGAVKE